MKPSWLLEKDTFKENLGVMVDAIRAQGMEAKVVEHHGFGGNQYENLFDHRDCVVVYGGLTFARQVQRTCPWVPGAYLTLKNFECTSYYPRLGKYLLNGDYVMLPYGELLRRQTFLLESLGSAGCLFVRPNSGFKSFTGTVICVETYERDVRDIGHYNVDPDTLVIVATPKNIYAEYRLVIAQGRVVAASLYREDGRHVEKEGCPLDVWELGEEVAGAGWQPEPVWVLDVCRRRNGEVSVIEIGSFTSAGLYACEKTKVVEAVSEIALSDWKEIYG